MTLFGRLVGAHHVEDAIIGVLREWLPTYLHEVERQSGWTPGTLAKPKSYRVSSDAEKMPEDQTPAIVVVSPGVADTPLVNGYQIYQAQFAIEVSAVVSARGGMEESGLPQALRLARMYALALRACVVQQSDDGGILFRRDWVAEDYDDLRSIDDRTICVGKSRFAIEVPDVTDANAGPISPLVPDDPEATPPVPSPEWPIAVEADATIEKVPQSEDIQP